MDISNGSACPRTRGGVNNFRAYPWLLTQGQLLHSPIADLAHVEFIRSAAIDLIH